MVGEEFYAENAALNGTCLNVKAKANPTCPMCAFASEIDVDESTETLLTCAKEDGYSLPAATEKFEIPVMCGSGEEAEKRSKARIVQSRG